MENLLSACPSVSPPSVFLRGWGWVGPHSGGSHPLALSLPSSLHSLGCPGPADLAYSRLSPGFWRFLGLEASAAGSCLFGKLPFSVLRKKGSLRKRESLMTSGKNMLNVCFFFFLFFFPELSPFQALFCAFICPRTLVSLF